MVTDIEGVDYSTDHPDPHGLAQVGKQFACRYGGPGSASKHLTLSEARALTAAGVSIVAGAEGTAQGLAGGTNVGRSWATLAHGHYVRCGMPPTRPIYLAADWDVQVDEWPAVRQALAGAAEVLGADRVGIYGGYNAIAWAVRDNAARWLWQTYAWSGERVHPRAHILQYRNHVSLVGGTVDLDRASVSDYGQWTVGGTPPGGGDMALTEDQEKTLLDAAFSILHCYGGSGEPDTAHHVWTAHTNQRLTEIAQLVKGLGEVGDPGNPDPIALADLAAEIRDLAATVRDTPLVDPVAVAAAFANRPEIAATLAAAVAAQLAQIQGSITLSGSLSGGIRPPSE